MLTLEEAAQFCEKMLGLPDPLIFRTKSPLQFLNQAIKSFHLNIPFQNITLLAKTPGHQGVPDLSEIKVSVCNGFGGLCYTNNVFMKYLLTALDFDVDSVTSCCNPSHPDNHILSIVHSLLVPGDHYLVDVGCGYPTYEAIPLDFHVESPVYKSSFLSFKFVRKDDGVYERHHLQDFRKPKGVSEPGADEWKWFYDFTLTPRELDFFGPSMTEVYCCRFLKKIRILQFEEDRMLAMKEDNDTNGVLLIEISNDGTTRELITDDDSIIENISHLFKRIEKVTIISAVKHWKCFKTDLKS